MKKTKIICSIGPSSYDYDVFRNMVLSGMNVARINFSHASMEERETVVNLVKRVNKELNTNTAILYDTKGPDLRTGMQETEVINLVTGEKIKIVKDDILCNSEQITFNNKNVIDDISVGDSVLLEDGLFTLEVTEKDDKGNLICNIINGGKLVQKRGVNVPGVKLSMPFISEIDREDIKYACSHDGDILALSFVDSKENVLEVKEILKEQNREDMLIISKIESGTGITNIDEIIEVSDGIMVARGDLGVEMPIERLPIIQKELIKKCRQQGKICIVATEMLASMYTNSRPTRAEATDIANAVLDGTDAVMLSGETTQGKYPREAVAYMSDICKVAEENYGYNKEFNLAKKLNITETIAKNVIKTDLHLSAKLIVVPTLTGYSAKKISNLKPNSPILALCSCEEVARKLALNWGVYTKVVPHYNSMDEILIASREKACKFKDMSQGDIVIIAGGFKVNTHNKATNFMKIEEI